MTYMIFEPGIIDEDLFRAVCAEYRLDPEGSASMLPYGDRGKVGWETRRLYFDLARGQDGLFNTEPALRQVADIRSALPVTRIFSFGKCNVSCPYCKRDCQFRDEDGNIIVATDVALRDLFALAEGAYARGETVRFSGGDPVVLPKQTLAIAAYMRRRYGAKVSIAHNGSGPAWVKKLAPDLASAAIDLKAVSEKMGHIMGVSAALGERIYRLSEETQAILSSAGVILDVRTPIFGDTSLEEMRQLAETVSKNNPRTTFWTWRLYKAVHGCDWVVPQKEIVFGMLDRVSAEFPHLWMGVRAKWEGGGMMYWLGGQRLTPMEMSYAEKRGSGNNIELLRAA
ncbi:4Fe-4S cluster-binding domain-containing protein [Candidatus Kaiserbacteria bacterium]|nr:4Fe-4S cluster-binding domain-containing protein [Candidatus Kaiserbacteria bacterium]